MFGLGKAKELNLPIPLEGSVWRHRKGALYTVIAVLNADATDTGKYPITIAYRGADGKKWARLLPSWHNSMVRVDDQEVIQQHKSTRTGYAAYDEASQFMIDSNKTPRYLPARFSEGGMVSMLEQKEGEMVPFMLSRGDSGLLSGTTPLPTIDTALAQGSLERNQESYFANGGTLHMPSSIHRVEDPPSGIALFEAVRKVAAMQSAHYEPLDDSASSSSSSSSSSGDDE